MRQRRCAESRPGRLQKRVARRSVAAWLGFLCIALLVGTSATLAASESFDEPDPLFDDDFDDRFGDEFGDEFDDEWNVGPTGYPDPGESTNRGVFAFNREVDRWILDPVTEAYQWAVPKPAREAIARMFINLGSTKTLVNDFLQLEWRDAGVTGSRLVVNSTLGLIGLFDVAEKIGLPGHESDFGQTLALAGTPSGPYILLPVLGPATVRDGFGTVVDGFFQPTYYILGPSNLLLGPTEILLYSGGSGISTRDRHFRELKALEDSSVDFYAAMRSGYYQRRIDEIWGRRQGHRTSAEPNYRTTSDSENEPEAVLDPLDSDTGDAPDAGIDDETL